MARHNVTLVYLLLYCSVFTLGIVPASGFFTWFKCLFTVCCNEKWIIKNFTGLETELNSRLHGQHLVKKTVLGHIKAHFKSPSPSKALVLSFHGPTGVGKNHVSRIIADNIYKNGMHNSYVHLISATKEFQHSGMAPFYKDQLKNWIEGNVTRCERSMFIFDEVDKFPSELLDVIQPYLDYYVHLGGIDYRKAVFIFLSNSGSTKIVNAVLEHWRAGKKREDLELRDVEHDVMLAAINDERGGGLWHSHLISNHLITAFIPFLPLARQHVRKCIEDDLLAKRHFYQRNQIPQKVVDEVMEELKFMPVVERIFSSTGCKRISEKVDYIMVDTEPHSFDNSQQQRQRDEM